MYKLTFTISCKRKNFGDLILSSLLRLIFLHFFSYLYVRGFKTFFSFSVSVNYETTHLETNQLRLDRGVK